MEPTIKIKLNTEQIISMLNQLDFDKRISVFKEFTDEWLLFLGIGKSDPVTIEEYNKKLEQGLKNFHDGNILSHQEMKEEIKKWKTQKS